MDNTTTYCLDYIISDQLSEKEISQVSEKIKAALLDSKIIKDKEESTLRRKLVYPIKKSNFGYYSSLIFETKPENIQRIESKLKTTDDILRYLIVNRPLTSPAIKVEAKSEGKKVEEKKVEKSLNETQDKEEKTEKPKKIKTEKKKVIIKQKAPKKTEIAEEIETETEKMKELEEKLEEILKE
ncbi:MAG: 30S ribosomal protein S6 [Candidatus Berkelbacteria bacterium]|nr:30S ribosomal protein S6 [Candidatus Berkelbacteria bacterium]